MRSHELTLADIEPIHVGAYVKAIGKTFEKPTVKQHLAAIRMLFDWLVVGQVVAINPAHSVRGPKHVIKRGKTAVLSAEEARKLLDSIDVSTLIGLRDRALIALMVFSFARVGAAVGMQVEDYFGQGKRWSLRLDEKGGKRHKMPAHHTLEAYLDAYIEVAGLSEAKIRGIVYYILSTLFVFQQTNYAFSQDDPLNFGKNWPSAILSGARCTDVNLRPGTYGIWDSMLTGGRFYRDDNNDDVLFDSIVTCNGFLNSLRDEKPAIRNEAALNVPPKPSKDISDPLKPSGRCVVASPSDGFLNIRNAPSGKLSGQTATNGTIVDVISASKDAKGKWWANIGAGYIYAPYINCGINDDMPSESAAIAPTLDDPSKPSGRCTVTSYDGFLNVRTAPFGSLTGKKVLNGEAVDVVSSAKDSKGTWWANIGAGFVNARYIDCHPENGPVQSQEDPSVASRKTHEATDLTQKTTHELEQITKEMDEKNCDREGTIPSICDALQKRLEALSPITTDNGSTSSTDEPFKAPGSSKSVNSSRQGTRCLKGWESAASCIAKPTPGYQKGTDIYCKNDNNFPVEVEICHEDKSEGSCDWDTLAASRPFSLKSNSPGYSKYVGRFRCH